MDARAGYGVGALSGTARIRLRRLALPAVCAFLGALVALLVGLITTPSGDAPSHLFQTWLFSNGGFEVWNNYWYAGRYEFVTYSVFYYPLAAQVGQKKCDLPLRPRDGLCVLHGHCHQKALTGTAATVALLERIPGS